MVDELAVGDMESEGQGRSEYSERVYWTERKGGHKEIESRNPAYRSVVPCRSLYSLHTTSFTHYPPNRSLIRLVTLTIFPHSTPGLYPTML